MHQGRYVILADVEVASCRKVELSLACLQSVFHLQIDKAAKELGVGLTMLKKRCRMLHIHRWPYRALASLEKLLSGLDTTDESHPHVCQIVSHNLICGSGAVYTNKMRHTVKRLSFHGIVLHCRFCKLLLMYVSY